MVDPHAASRAEATAGAGSAEFSGHAAHGGEALAHAETVAESGVAAVVRASGETKGSGCFGCVGRLIAVAVVAFAAWVIVDVGLRRFVESDLAAAWKAAADDVPVRKPRSAVDGLIEIGPRESLLPIVVTFDPADPVGVHRVAALLRWQSERGVDLGLPTGREPRIVLLPVAGAEGSDLVRRLLVLHSKGELVDAWPELVAGDAGIEPAALIRHAAEADIDEAGLTILAQATAARELERTVATISRVFGLRPPFSLAVAGRALPSAAVEDPAALTQALEQAAATALAAARDHGPAAWEELLQGVPEAQAERWSRWIVRGERVAATAPAADAPNAAALPDGPQRLSLPVGTQTRGSSGGVQLVFVADLQCDYSRMLTRRLARLLDDHADVELAFVHRPILSLHPDAERAARLAQAAVAQGAFWQVVDWIFVHGRTLDSARMVRSLGRKGTHLDGEALESLATSPQIGDVIAAHIAWSDAHGVNGTPTLFVDGRPLRGAVATRALNEAVQRAIALRASWQDAHPGAAIPVEPAAAATSTVP